MVVGKGSFEPGCVLIIDDDPAMRRLLTAALAAPAPGLAARVAENLAEGIAFARAGSCAAAILSLDLIPGETAESITALRRAGLAGPIFVTSRQGSVATAVEAVRAGADDFLVKPLNVAELVRRLIARLGLIEIAPIESEHGDRFEGFIGTSSAMRAIYERIERIAPSKAPVFITGESGSGKEIAAEAIHTRSERARRPFIALNCSAIPRELMESEIFGHVRGAFTGAHEDRAGAAELAHGGTLFLDEICEMDLALQAKLLRLIQTATLRRVGDTRLREIDVRFLCATNREPAREIEVGRFREDLFYRLHVLPLHLPSLRERAGDIVLIARAFLERFAEEEGRAFRGFTPEAEIALEAFVWPGNVRQLQNVVRRVVVLHDGEYVNADMLALSGAATHEAARDTGPLPRHTSPAIDPYWQQEQRIIEQALKAFGGNTQKAAAALEISPSTIYRKLQAWAGRQIA